jgi:tetratricopeptide (TPR) repeat protein
MGEWDWVLTEGQRLLEEDLEEGDRFSVARGVEEVMAYRGDPIDQLLAGHREYALASGNPTPTSNYHGALAALQFAQGDYVASAESWLKSADLNTTNLPVDLPRAARAYVWAKDSVKAQEYLDRYQLTNIHGAESEALVATIRAGILALDGHRDEALGEYAIALDRWAVFGVEFDRSLVGLQMLLTLGATEPAVVAAVEDARATLERLQAAPLLALIDQHMGATATKRAAPLPHAAPVATEKESAPALDVPAA